MKTLVPKTRLATWMIDDGTRLRRGRLAAAIAIGYAGFAVTYLTINEFSVGRDAHRLYLPGEEGLPFLPAFEFLYVLTYFVPLLLLATIRDYATFLRLCRASFAILVCAYATYLVFPVYFERPPLRVISLATWLLSLEYLDKSYNHFPSLHVAWTWLAVFSAQIPMVAKMGWCAVAVAISVSTLFVKQHYVADVLYGFVLAWLAWRLAGPRRS